MKCGLGRFVTFTSALVAVLMASTVAAAPVLFSAAGANGAAIQGTVDAFRTAIGGGNNGNAPGPIAGGRREINWDGAPPATTTASVGTPFSGFQNNRGALFTTPGSGFVQSPLTEGAPADQTLGEFFSNATYGTTFAAFSLNRVFAPVGSNITDGTFFLPGSSGAIAAGVNAFGAVFSDVDIADTTRIEFFDLQNVSLLSQFVLPAVGAAPLNASFSFLGVKFDPGVLVGRVRITTGAGVLGPNNDSPTNDLVVMDDLVFAEPVAVPEPGTLTLLGLGLLAARRMRR